MEEINRIQTDKMVIKEETGVRQYKTEIKTIQVKGAIKIQQNGNNEEGKKTRMRHCGQERWDMHRKEWQKREAIQFQDIEEESRASQENLENHQENESYWIDELENWQRNLGDREDPQRIAVIVALFGVIISVAMIIVFVLYIRALLV